MEINDEMLAVGGILNAAPRIAACATRLDRAVRDGNELALDEMRCALVGLVKVCDRHVDALMMMGWGADLRDLLSDQ